MDVRLEILHAFGSHTGKTIQSDLIRQTVLFAEESSSFLIFPVGKQVAIQHAESGCMNFIPPSSVTVESIIGLSVVNNITVGGKNPTVMDYLAVCEKNLIKGELFVEISVYNLRGPATTPIKQITAPFSLIFGQSGFALLGFDVSFSSDGRLICIACSGTKDGKMSNSVVVFDWYKRKVKIIITVFWKTISAFLR